jgi:putative transposase
MPEAIASVFPKTVVQTCIVRLIGNSLDHASWQDRKALASALKPIYTALNKDHAPEQFGQFEASELVQKHVNVCELRRGNWERVSQPINARSNQTQQIPPTKKT